MTREKQDTYTTDIVRKDPTILALLLKDQTLSSNGKQTNISWATDEYADILRERRLSEEEYDQSSQVQLWQVSGKNVDVISPRVTKHIERQTARSKNRAEVFTPAWICNKQNNLIDERWLGYADAFNKETTLSDGTKSWTTNNERVVFANGKSWMRYVRSRRLEITCGEGPYIVSRYDTTTGERINIHDRIGFLDRKIRVINENTPAENNKANKRHWLRKVYQALQSVYGFDWQGDNVFLTRESILHSFCDYYIERWQRMPHMEAIKKAAEIISWNIWQMDGTNFTIPNTDTYAIIMEWHGTEPLKGKRIAYKDLLTGKIHRKK